MTLVEEVMTVPVITLTKDMTLSEATTEMAKKGVSGAPVVDDQGRLVGILCESDILEFAASKEGAGLEIRSLSFVSLPYDRIVQNAELCSRYKKVGETKVEDAMNEEVVTIEHEEDVQKALEVMVRMNFDRLPVVDGGNLVGIISRQNILVAMCRELGDKGPPFCETIAR